VNVVITTCTNRKRKPVLQSLCANLLPQGDLSSLAASWGVRLNGAEALYPAHEVYGGRAFREASRASDKINGKLLIVSAGLGLVESTRLIPSYACTVQEGVVDSISARIDSGFSRVDWWRALKQVSPYHVDLAAQADQSVGLILAALSESYIELLAGDLLSLGDDHLSRLRLFTRTPASRLPEKLRAYVMPYDDRLDGPDSPIKGARSDFAPRALRHFVELIAPSKREGASAKEHSDAVGRTLQAWRFPQEVERVRKDDSEIVRLLEAHWDDANGSTSRLLRLFRDELKISCEQGRFAVLARQVREGRA
jgi:hypothetical protein